MRAPGLNGERHVREHRLAVVPDCRVLQHEDRVGAAGKLAEVERERRVHVRRRDQLHALERLDPALRLARLGRLGAEAVDEALQARDLALLPGVHRLLVRELRGALRLERGVVAAVAPQLAPVDVQDRAWRPRRGTRGRARPGSACRDSAASQPSSQTTASRSRWLVGSSSSSRSERHISVRARFRRMRQPPENAADAAREVVLGEAEPVEQRRGARARRVAVDVGVGCRARRRGARPSPPASAVAQLPTRRGAAPRRRPSRTRSRADRARTPPARRAR